MKPQNTTTAKRRKHPLVVPYTNIPPVCNYQLTVFDLAEKKIETVNGDTYYFDSLVKVVNHVLKDKSRSACIALKQYSNSTGDLFAAFVNDVGLDEKEFEKVCQRVGWVGGKKRHYLGVDSSKGRKPRSKKGV